MGSMGLAMYKLLILTAFFVFSGFASEQSDNDIMTNEETSSPPFDISDVPSADFDEGDTAPFRKVDCTNYLLNSKIASSCIKPENMASSIVEKENGWVIPLKITKELIDAILEKNGGKVANIVLQEKGCEPAIVKGLFLLIEKGVQKISDEAISILQELKILELETFSTWLERLELKEKYAAKIEEFQVSPSFSNVIPVTFENREISFEFGEKLKNLLDGKLKIAGEIITIEGSVKKLLEEKKEKIPLETQKNLDELLKLKAEKDELLAQVTESRLEKEKKSEAIAKEIKQVEVKKKKKESDKDILAKNLKTVQKKLGDDNKNLENAKKRLSNL
ncbi:MAG: hypothetical protein LBI95_03315, partial [Holosporales bacterium]|nr:hypothetical protein [Holosporales bacterium]